MAFLDEKEVYSAYQEATKEADLWRIDYPQYERLMDNGLMEGLDDNLPEVNDGSLSASLFKLAKRVIKKKLGGRTIALDADEPWVTELANIRWEKSILPNANTQATPRRKWKDAVRKAAGYGGQPIITLFTDHGSDFMVPYCQDVKLEAGKCSDMDSDIIFWDVYYTKLQVQNMIEEAQEEMDEAKTELTSWTQRKKDGLLSEDEQEAPEPYNTWYIDKLQKIYDENDEENRSGNEEARERLEKGAKKTGIKFYVAWQRGINAPFYMCHNKTVVRSWSNPDPTGDIPCHYLYCYQDFVNPYGIGIVKLAGGTQNVMDYLTKADILATQVGISPPKLIAGDEDSVDLTSMVMAPNANWFVGQTKVEPWQMSNGIYQELPGRMAMYNTRLQKMLPTGDTTASSTDSGDPNVSKTPAGVKLAAANLSIDDEDFSENVDECYALVAKSMINTEFANMQGSDLMKLNDDERQLLIKGGMPWPMDEQGQPIGNQIDVIWDEVRCTVNFEIDPEADKAKDEEKRLEGLLKVAEFVNNDPNFDAVLMQDGKKLNKGELYSEIISLTSDNKKIIEDISPEESQQAQAQQPQGPAPEPPKPVVAYKDAPEDVKRQMEQKDGYQPSAEVSPVQIGLDQKARDQAIQAQGQMHSQDMAEAQHEHTVNSSQADMELKAGAQQQSQQESEGQAEIKAIMQQYGVDEQTAQAVQAAENNGFSTEEIKAYIESKQPEEATA